MHKKNAKNKKRKKQKTNWQSFIRESLAANSLSAYASFPHSTRVFLHVPAKCQLPSQSSLANQAQFHIRNKALVLLVPRDITNLERQHSSIFQQLCHTFQPNIHRLNNSWMATQTAKKHKSLACKLFESPEATQRKSSR